MRIVIKNAVMVRQNDVPDDDNNCGYYPQTTITLDNGHEIHVDWEASIYITTYHVIIEA